MPNPSERVFRGWTGKQHAQCWAHLRINSMVLKNLLKRSLFHFGWFWLRSLGYKLCLPVPLPQITLNLPGLSSVFGPFRWHWCHSQCTWCPPELMQADPQCTHVTWKFRHVGHGVQFGGCPVNKTSNQAFPVCAHSYPTQCNSTNKLQLKRKGEFSSWRAQFLISSLQWKGRQHYICTHHSKQCSWISS